MSPERREVPRVAVALEAFLGADARGLLRYVTRDISLDGVFVQTGPVDLARGDVAEVALRIPANGRRRIHRFPVTVARANHAGVALSFGPITDDEAYAALLELVFARQNA
jgi:hypothetical protein